MPGADRIAVSSEIVLAGNVEIVGVAKRTLGVDRDRSEPGREAPRGRLLAGRAPERSDQSALEVVLWERTRNASVEDVDDEQSQASWSQPVEEAPDDSVDLPAPSEISETQLLETRLAKIGTAFHEFHSEFGHFPPAASRDVEGKPLLSWRVHLLPFL